MDRSQGDGASESFDPPRFLRLLTALSFLFFATWLLNQYVFPVYDAAFLYLRDWVEIVSGVIFVVMAVVASRTAAPFVTRWFIFLTAGSVALGWLLVVLAMAIGSPAVLALGAVVTSVGNGFIYALACTSFLDSGHRQAALAIASASAISLLLRFLAPVMGPVVGLQLYFVMHVAVFFVLLRDARRGLGTLEHAGSIRDAQLVKPSSFLPFGSQIFICILVFRFVFGVALTYNEVGRIPIGTDLDIIPVLLVVVYMVVMWVRRRDFDLDLIFRISFLLVLGGFFLVSIGGQAPEGLANTFLYSGSALFDIVSFYVVVAIGTRNRLGAISVFCWGTAMKAFGVVIGANLGRVMNTETVVPVGLLMFAVVIVFAGYMVYFIGHQRFADVIAGITPLEEVKVATGAGEDGESADEGAVFRGNCDRLAREYDLTARERDVLELLARGRNGHYIQEKLVVSYNTVKTHVFHIYSKLGVHTQQEIIDLVEDPTRAVQLRVSSSTDPQAR